MRKICAIIFVLFFFTTVQAQLPKCVFTHYSSENGLPQKTVMHIMQDHTGIMWFSTWDGLCKFDGYSFTNYKASKDNLINLANNRIDFFDEDKFGFIWLQTYDNYVYRFDVQKEQFMLASEEKASRLKILPNGNVWLFLSNGKATRISTNEKDFSFSAQNFSRNNGFSANKIIDVYLDSINNEWALTNGGLYVVNGENASAPQFFADKQSQPFYCAAETAENIFFGTAQGKIYVFNKTTKQFYIETFETDANIIDIKPIANGEFFVATNNDGFFIFNLNHNQKEHYTTSNCKNLESNKISKIYVDKCGEVWIDQHIEACIAHFNPQTRTLKTERVKIEQIPVSSGKPPFQIVEDVNGFLWVHPFGGGFSFYDRAKNELLPFYNETHGNNWHFSNKVHSMATDGQGNLWMCTHSKGLEKISFVKNLFYNYRPLNVNYETSGNDTRSIFIEKNKNRIWFGSRDGSIRIYDTLIQQYFGFLNSKGIISKGELETNGAGAYHIMKDSRGRIWIATKGKGLVKLENEKDGHFEISKYTKTDNIYSLSNNDVYYIHEDKNHRIWVATYGGGINYIQENADGEIKFINYLNNLKDWISNKCQRVRMITSDNDGNIWAGTTNGAVCFNADFSNPEEIKFCHYFRQPKQPNSLSDNDVHWITCANNGDLFLATFGGGLNKLVSRNADSAEFKIYTTDNGFLSNVLLAIQEDDKHNLWISSEDGLTKFNPATEQSETYDNSYFNFNTGFNEGSCANINGRFMIFGSSNGFSCFYPDSIHKSAYVPPIILSKLRILQKKNAKDSSLIQNLNNTQKIKLSHNQNIFNIQYTALDMIAPEKVKYAYKLDGFEMNWNYVDNLRNAVYTNIPKGDYVFRVKSTNSDGVWVDNERTLDITVLPSFWQRPIAYLLYVLLFMLIVFATVYMFLKFYRLKQKVQMEKEISDLKLRFFTNISHELRTPLTLIAGPVEQVLQDQKLSDESRNQLSVVKRNSDRMLHLVNQILDFRKVQNKKMKLQVQKIEVVSFTRRVMDNFNQIAIEHQIDYVFEPEKSELYLWADANKLEMIIFNLLSNAFKYTSAGKMICVFVAEDERTISIGVQDQGVGISEKEKKSLFVRFENLIDKNIFSQSSSGIGLSLVKEFTDMHKATIDVESAPGKGSLFTVNFLKGKDHYDENVEFILNDYNQPKIENTDNAADEQLPENIEIETDKPLMLLVEDNVELRSFLRSIFNSKFRIIEAGNGAEGITKAMRFIPDLIISDVIMPQKDGIAMTKELRANLNTSHIPIILLTAKTADDDKLEGLKIGADSYITKPFSSTYLQARVDNILNRRKHLQDIYRQNLAVENIIKPQNEPLKLEAHEEEQEQEEKSTEISPNDRKFMNKLMELMELNIDNGELMVEELARELAVSRSVFFKKLKALTGLAPIEFIREIRINRAAKLIETEDITMTEIAEKVGINDSRYFSKCFKHQFGMTPTEYKEKMKKK